MESVPWIWVRPGVTHIFAHHNRSTCASKSPSKHKQMSNLCLSYVNYPLRIRVFENAVEQKTLQSFRREGGLLSWWASTEETSERLCLVSQLAWSS
jgi:hypothetical protein